MQQLLDIFLHLDRHLDDFVRDHGAWTYALLFAIVFCETGLVVTPFLPGDSLLFAVGAISARGSLDVLSASVVLYAAAAIGDNVNYAIGRYIGPRIFRAEANTHWLGKLLSRKHLDRAHAFYERHGGKAVFLGHFVPIIRTFAPFVAGAGSMNYARFLLFNLTGVAAWVGICVGAGYAFGSREVVKNNFSLFVLGIVVVSLIPAVVEIIKGMKRPAAQGARESVEVSQATPPRGES